MNSISSLGSLSLFSLSISNDIDSACSLLQSSPSLLDATNDCGHTALFLAAQHGHINMVRFLLTVGAFPWIHSNGYSDQEIPSVQLQSYNSSDVDSRVSLRTSRELFHLFRFFRLRFYFACRIYWLSRLLAPKHCGPIVPERIGSFLTLDTENQNRQTVGMEVAKDYVDEEIRLLISFSAMDEKKKKKDLIQIANHPITSSISTGEIISDIILHHELPIYLHSLTEIEEGNNK